MANQNPSTNTYSLRTSLQHASAPHSSARKSWLQLSWALLTQIITQTLNLIHILKMEMNSCTRWIRIWLRVRVAGVRNGGRWSCLEAWLMISGGGRRFIGVIGRMRGIIGLCLLRFICILRSKIVFPISSPFYKNLEFHVSYLRIGFGGWELGWGEGTDEIYANWKTASYQHWLSPWICKFWEIERGVTWNWFKV